MQSVTSGAGFGSDTAISSSSGGFGGVSSFGLSTEGESFSKSKGMPFIYVCSYLISELLTKIMMMLYMFYEDDITLIKANRDNFTVKWLKIASSFVMCFVSSYSWLLCCYFSYRRHRTVAASFKSKYSYWNPLVDLLLK